MEYPSSKNARGRIRGRRPRATTDAACAPRPSRCPQTRRRAPLEPRSQRSSLRLREALVVARLTMSEVRTKHAEQLFSPGDWYGDSVADGDPKPWEQGQ